MSNIFFGWGGEGDNLYARLIIQRRYQIERYPSAIGRYASLAHVDKQQMNTHITVRKVIAMTSRHNNNLLKGV